MFGWSRLNEFFEIDIDLINKGKGIENLVFQLTGARTVY